MSPKTIRWFPEMRPRRVGKGNRRWNIPIRRSFWGMAATVGIFGVEASDVFLVRCRLGTADITADEADGLNLEDGA